MLPSSAQWLVARVVWSLTTFPFQWRKRAFTATSSDTAAHACSFWSQRVSTGLLGNHYSEGERERGRKKNSKKPRYYFLDLLAALCSDQKRLWKMIKWVVCRSECRPTVSGCSELVALVGCTAQYEESKGGIDGYCWRGVRFAWTLLSVHQWN